jgi:DNA-binding MarR family transcriptional regulator
LNDAGVVVTERDPDDGRRVLVSIAPGIRTGLFRPRARNG